MSKNKITQAAFDDVVRENQEEFDMTVEEAIADALEQFRTQGADVSKIITKPKLALPGGNLDHAVLVRLKKVESVNEVASLPTSLAELKADLEDVPSRSLAGAKGGLDVLMMLAEKYRENSEVLVAILETIAKLIEGQPDLLLPGGIPKDNIPEAADNAYLSRLIEIGSAGREKSAVVVSSVNVLRNGCVMHEINRQAAVNHGVAQYALDALADHKTNQDVVVEVSQLLRTLILDDDIRVPFGKAHDHAKLIVSKNALILLIDALKHHSSSPEVSGEVINTIGKLAVRNEFCQQIAENNGISLIYEILQQHASQINVVVAALAAIKLISGNDEVKSIVCRSGLLFSIIQIMQQHLKNPEVAEQGCSCLAAVSLRNVDNAQTIVDNGGANVIVKIITVHQNNEKVLKQACNAIRNIVARSPDLREIFLSEGAEHFIKEGIAKHPSSSTLSEAGKAALRDLGCDVQLKMLWTGDGKNLARD